MAKVAQLKVVLPQTLVKAARSRTNPAQAVEAGQVIQDRSAYALLNNTARNYKTAQSIPALIRFLARAEGPISAAVHNMVQVANCSHTVTAYNAATHEFSEEGTALANSILASMNTLYDYTAGFSSKKSLEGLKGHMLREVVLTGALSSELVLNEARLPSYIQVVPFETLEMVSNGKGGYYPQQRVSGENEPVKLNIPTFFVSMMQHDANSVYAFSMMDSAVKLIIYFEEFMEDIRRSVRQSGHTRTTVTLDTKKIVDAAPRDVKQDQKKLKEWMETVQAAVQQQLQTLSPEDALVLFDTAKAENLQSGLGQRMDYTPLLNVISGVYATSMKTPPSAIGLRLEGGSQALGNVESLIFLKTAAAVQTPVEEVLSRSLTLGCRLYGMDVYVEFQFDPINLRPEEELEAFRTMKQTRILELLSLGMISDAYAAHLLKTGPRPAGAEDLSGTFFHKTGGLGNNQPSTFPGDTAMGRTLQPGSDAPRKGGGKSQ